MKKEIIGALSVVLVLLIALSIGKHIFLLSSVPKINSCYTNQSGNSFQKILSVDMKAFDVKYEYINLTLGTHSLERISPINSFNNYYHKSDNCSNFDLAKHTIEIYEKTSH